MLNSGKVNFALAMTFKYQQYINLYVSNAIELN